MFPTHTELLHNAFEAYRKQLAIMGWPTDGLNLVCNLGTYRVDNGDGGPGPGLRPSGFLGHEAGTAAVTLESVTAALEFATSWSVNEHERVTR